MLKYLFVLKWCISVNIIVNWVVSCVLFGERFDKKVQKYFSLRCHFPRNLGPFIFKNIFARFQCIIHFFLTKEYIQGLIFHSWAFSVFFCWKSQSERADDYILCILCRHILHKEQKKPMEVPQGLQLKLTLNECF